jgi:hypothetical protein
LQQKALTGPIRRHDPGLAVSGFDPYATGATVNPGAADSTFPQLRGMSTDLRHDAHRHLNPLGKRAARNLSQVSSMLATRARHGRHEIGDPADFAVG